MRFIIFFITISYFAATAQAQITVSGRVLDISKINYVEKVAVKSTSGRMTVTDSMGRYQIFVNDNDSIYFFYNNRPTQKFPVRNIANPSEFDISLRLAIPGRYSALKEVTVYSKTHQQDSLENREEYNDIFGYSKPGLSSSMVPGGVPGADLDQLINLFRKNRNRRLKSFKRRLELDEQEKYIDYRFNKKTVGRITGLTSNLLDSFMTAYRPSYEFTAASDEITFNQYILNAYYLFKKNVSVSPAKKEE